MNTENAKPSYYAVIPANVRYDKRLKPLTRLLYGEISCLSNKHGYCWASNKYLSELYEVSIQTIMDCLRELKEYGYIVTETSYNKNGCGGQVRLIWLSECYLYEKVGGIKETLNKVVYEKLNKPTLNDQKNNINQNNQREASNRGDTESAQNLSKDLSAGSDHSSELSPGSNPQQLNTSSKKSNGSNFREINKKSRATATPTPLPIITTSVRTCDETIDTRMSEVDNDESKRNKEAKELKAQQKEAKRKTKLAMARQALVNRLHKISSSRTDNVILLDILAEIASNLVEVKGMKFKPNNWEAHLDMLYEFGKTDEERIRIARRTLANRWLSFYSMDDNNPKTTLYISDQHTTSVSDKDINTIARATNDDGFNITF